MKNILLYQLLSVEVLQRIKEELDGYFRDLCRDHAAGGFDMRDQIREVLDELNLIDAQIAEKEGTDNPDIPAGPNGNQRID